MKITKQEIKKLLATTWLTLLKLANATHFQSFWYDYHVKDEDIILSIANTPYETHRLAMEAKFNAFMYN